MKENLKRIVFAFICLFAVGVMNVNAETVVSVTNHSELNAALINPDVDVVKLGNDIIAEDSLDFRIEPGSVTTKTLDLNGNTLDLGASYDITLKNRDVEANFIVMDSGTTGKITQITNNDRAMFYLYNYTESAKKINFTIDGGKYETNRVGYNGGLIYGNHEHGENNVIIKNATVDGYVLFRGTLNKISIENLTLANTYTSHAYENTDAKLYEDSTITYADILGENYEAVIKNPDNSEIAIPTDTELGKRITEISSIANINGAIVIREKDGLKVNNIEISEVFGYKEATLKDITIKNTGKTAVEIASISFSDSNFEFVEGNKTIDAGSTDTSWKVKAKSGLNAGTYTATITVTDKEGKTYTATVTLKVEQKQLDGLGIGFTGNWTYGEPALEPTITGVGSLGADEYTVEYAKTGTDWSTVKPTTAGDYTIRLTITGSNYKTATASSTFKILPTEKVVKIVANSSSHRYDGNEYTDNGYKVYLDGVEMPNGKLFYDDVVSDVKINGSVTDVVDNTANNNVIDRDDIIITNRDSYKNIEFEDGTIEITPIPTPIIVTANSDSKFYDGSYLRNGGYTFTEGVLLAGDTLKVETSMRTERSNAGTYENKVNRVTVMRDDKYITDNYTFGTHVSGTLTIKPAERNFEINDVNVLVGQHLSYLELKDKLNLSVLYHNNPDFNKVSGEGSYDITAGFNAPSTPGTTIMEIILHEEDIDGDGIIEYTEVKKQFKVIASEKESVTISGLEDNQEFTYDGNTKTPAGTITVEDNKVAVSELEVTYNGTGSTTYSNTTAPKTVGTYEVTYKVKDSNPNYVGSVTYAFTIKKAQLNKPTASTISFVYDGTSKGYSSFHDNETFEFTGTNTATNVGNYSLTISLKDKDNYEWKDGTTVDVVINWSITRATPDFTVPTGLVGVKGDFLRSIILPSGFTWNNPNEILTAGTHTYKATYTPEDTTNYKVIDDVEITVVVKDKFILSGVVSGGNGTISTPSLEVLEGEKVEITFTPDEGYMIDKVLVEGTEVEVTGNKLELTMDGHKIVSVTYKKIPFTVTVKEVTGATITPNGAVSVNYGDNKEFAITVNSGYKLVKVLVNGTDKTADMVDDKLTLSNITANMEIEVVVEKIAYEVTEGANQKYVITKNSEAKFKINADYRLFDGKVYVDGVLVDSENYTSESGSTIITFKKEYVDSLSAGEHTLKVTFTDGGEASTKFKVANVTTDDNTTGNNTTSEVDNPKTGDNIVLYMITGILSMIGLAGVGVFVYRRKQTN